MTSSDATRCAKCGGPFGGYRTIIDGMTYHQSCAVMSYPSHTPEDYSRASAEIVQLREAMERALTHLENGRQHKAENVIYTALRESEKRLLANERSRADG